jgi:16S rRNA (uracil1498-N3)-methyltransferase
LLSDDEKHHAFKVLRLVPGDAVEICDGAGRIDTCEVESNQPACAKFRILTSKVLERPFQKACLICPALDHGELDDVMAGFAETGIDEVLVYLPQGADKKRIGAKKTSRWKQKLRVGTKQCKRPFLPTLEVYSSLQNALEAFGGQKNIFVGDPEGDPTESFYRAGSGSAQSFAAESLAFVCGCEHGLGDAELELLQDHHGIPVALGPHVLRAKTAALLGSHFLVQVRACLPP